TAAVVKKELTAAPVFARLLERAARAMERAGKRLESMARNPPPVAELPDAEANRDQGEAIRRLDQLLASLQEAHNEPRPLSRGQGGGQQGDMGNGPPPGDDSLPPLAQLRLLRSLQKEVNDRTEAFRKKHPDLDKLGPKEKAELQEIRREQKEVADLL